MPYYVKCKTCYTYGCDYVFLEEQEANFYCPSCIVQMKPAKCTGCEFYFMGQAKHYDNRIFCSRCVVTCEVCQQDVLVEDLAEDMPEELHICNSCNPPNAIFSYHEDVLEHLDFMGEAPYFGVELELLVKDYTPKGYIMGLKQMAAHFSDWGIPKYDSSLPTFSLEFVTAPASLEIHQEKWGNLASTLSEFFSGDNETCGMHIHMSREGLSPLEEFKLFTFIHNKANSEFLEFMAKRSMESEWAESYYKLYELKNFRHMYSVNKKTKKLAIMEVDYQSPSHHAALARGDKTLEFRIFQSTTDVNIILARIEFIAALRQFVKTDSSILRNSYLPFLKWIKFQKGFKNFKAIVKNFSGGRLLSASS